MNKCYEARKKRGLCCKCGKVPPREGKVMCQECADKDNERRLSDVRWFKSMGLCRRCGRERVFGSEAACPECLAKEYTRNQRYIRKNYGNIHNFYLADKAKLKAAGLCRRCRKKKVVEGHTYCQECMDKMRERSRHYRLKNRFNDGKISRFERFSYGLCYICGNPLDTDKRLCSSCCEKAGNRFDGHRGKAWQKTNAALFRGAANG